MSSIAEQIAETVRVALHNAIPAVGTRVHRGREDAIGRDECPCITIACRGENTDNAEADAEVEGNLLTIEVAVHVAAGAATVWETAADDIVTAAHPLIRAAVYPGTGGPPMRVARSWQGASGDASPGAVVLTYRFDYWNSTADLATFA